MLVALGAVLPDRSPAEPPRSWYAAGMLFLYAAGFSFAYVSLSAGTGALILFGAVQVTMIVVAMQQGERLRRWQWAGLGCAVAGVVYLVLPGLAAPSPTGAALMAAAGIAWGLYSMRGRGSMDPVGQTRRNFVLTLPMVAVLAIASLGRLEASRIGVMLAVISGAITSGLGYVIWYRALRTLSGTGAALAQLATPVLTALGGILFLSEPFGLRLVISKHAQPRSTA
jgi:drug/metabolite transporter (DMT)-like permease